MLKMNPASNQARFSDQDIEAVRRGFSNDHGRYIALMDLSHFLSTDNVEALLPATEVVINRPMQGAPHNPSMVDIPTTSRNLDLDSLAPPAPPLPRMMKNLLKDRRRFQRQFVTSSALQIPEYDNEIVNITHKALENYQLKDLLKIELRGKPTKKSKAFKRELLFSAVESDNDGAKSLLKPEMEFKLLK